MSDIKRFVNIFEEIAKIPRCSGNESKIAQWILNRAEKMNFETRTDKAGNVCVRLNTGSRNTVVLQNHMDMVCEKDSERDHDFAKDPIETVIDGEWMFAKGTTLGADNGVGMAISFLLAAEDFPKPNLEILFTVDEERGLVGASNLDKSMLSGSNLINLDTETEGEFIIGCAGGRDTLIDKTADFNYLSIPELFKMEIGGLEGGHSGLDIDKGRLNAIKVLGEELAAVNREYPLCISDINGGTAHNAIPRSASAIFAVNSDVSAEKIKNLINESISQLSCEFDLQTMKNENYTFLLEKTSGKIIELINDMPDGVFTYDAKLPDKVETSSNLATVRTKDNAVELLVSQRSSNPVNLDKLTEKIEKCAAIAHARFETGNEYPGWTPVPDSEIVSLFKSAYYEIFGKEPLVDVVHAGLECGVIKKKFENMEMISLGPTIVNAHSPAERLNLPSVDKVIKLMRKILKRMA